MHLQSLYCALVPLQMLFKKAKPPAPGAGGLKAAAGDAREKERLKALEYLALSIDVTWPLSIVLSPHAMLVYQFYFKHLTLCKVRVQHRFM